MSFVHGNADFSPTTEQHVFSLAYSHYNPEIEMNSYIVFQYRLNSVVGNLKFLTNTEKNCIQKLAKWNWKEDGG